MTPERAALFAELLEEFAQDPRRFIPEPAYRPACRAFGFAALELCFVRRNMREQIEMLLLRRDDPDWKGRHFPGGAWRAPDTLEQGIAKLVRAELGEHSQATLLAKGDWEKWHDHPVGYPISQIVILSGHDIVETGARRWFTEPPAGMIADGGHHARYFASVAAQVERDLLI